MTNSRMTGVKRYDNRYPAITLIKTVAKPNFCSDVKSVLCILKIMVKNMERKTATINQE